LLGGRWPCPGPPAARWPWALGTLTVAPLAARRKMLPEQPAAPPEPKRSPWSGSQEGTGKRDAGGHGVSKGTAGRWHGAHPRVMSQDQPQVRTGTSREDGVQWDGTPKSSVVPQGALGARDTLEGQGCTLG